MGRTRLQGSIDPTARLVHSLGRAESDVDQTGVIATGHES